MILEDYLVHRLSQCDDMVGNLPEFIIYIKYLHSYMKPCGVTDFPLTFFGLIYSLIIP